MNNDTTTTPAQMQARAEPSPAENTTGPKAAATDADNGGGGKSTGEQPRARSTTHNRARHAKRSRTAPSRPANRAAWSSAC